jgi:hypothetical protein
LHEIVEELSEPAAELTLRALERWREDPVGLALAAAPLDDEPESPEERAAVELARAELRRGGVLSDEEAWGER